jgi:hypothetical protein
MSQGTDLYDRLVPCLVEKMEIKKLGIIYLLIQNRIFSVDFCSCFYTILLPLPFGFAK